MARATKAADIKAIEALDKEWGAAGTRHDVEAVVAMYAKDGVLVWPEAKAMHGTAAIRRAWKTFIDETPGFAIAFVAESITVSASGDLAVDFGKVILSMNDKDGKPQRMVAKYLVTWKKVRGAWKVQYDSWNSNTKG